MENKEKVSVNSKKTKIFIPTFTIVLMLIFVIPGIIVLFAANETIKSCDAEVTGIVDYEGDISIKNLADSVEGKYLSTGKNGRYWIKIIVRIDDKFKLETLYADRSYGNEGDRLTIHYNSHSPDEYYIGDPKDQYGISVAAFFLVVSGIFLALSVFLSIYYTIKGDDEEEESPEKTEEESPEEEAERLEEEAESPEEEAASSEEGAESPEEEAARIEKEEAEWLEKKKKAAERKREAEEKIDKETKRFTKKYTNQYIRKQIQDDVFNSKLVFWLLAMGAALVLVSFIRTYNDINEDNPIPFNNYFDNIDEKYYSVVITEKPVEVCSPENGSDARIFDLKVGNDHILAKYLDKKTVMGNDDAIKLRGKLRRISVSSEKTREIIKKYYQEIGYFETLNDEEFAYYYLDCSDISLWDELKKGHMLGFAFGITIIIVGLSFSYSILYFIRDIRPKCSGRIYKAEEIDRLANDLDTDWIQSMNVFVTPSSLIGLNHGLVVIDYKDIYGIKRERVYHKTKNRIYYTYRIIIETKNHKNMTLTECEKEYCDEKLAVYLDKRFVKYKLQKS